MFLKSIYLGILVSLFSASAVLADTGPGAKPGFSVGVSNADSGANLKLQTSEDSWVGDLIPIVVPLGVFAMIVALMFLKSRSKVQIAQARLEAIKIMAEKGMNVQADMLPGGGTQSDEKKPSSHRAITFIALGIGFSIYAMLNGFHASHLAIGVGSLIFGLGHLWLANKEQKQAK